MRIEMYSEKSLQAPSCVVGQPLPDDISDRRKPKFDLGSSRHTPTGREAKVWPLPDQTDYP
jgi:hypothetical protein